MNVIRGFIPVKDVISQVVIPTFACYRYPIYSISLCEITSSFFCDDCYAINQVFMALL